MLFARPAVGPLSVVVCVLCVGEVRFQFRLAGVGGEPQSMIVELALPCEVVENLQHRLFSVIN